MYRTRLGTLLLVLITAASAAVPASATESKTVRIAVAGPDDESHFAWAAARELKRVAAGKGIEVNVEPAPLAGSSEIAWDLMVMPVRSLATQVPALEILELPFFYPSLAAVHANLDGPLGERLDAEASQRGWKMVAFWDEGMHIFSGLKRFDRVRNLKAREFLITRPDPIAERQFRYWKADARRIQPENREAVLRECLIANRATTLQEVTREQLYRVHLAMSLTHHRYEGWVVVAPLDRWMQSPASTREALEAALTEIRAWQRRDTEHREAAALAELKRLGMTIYDVDTTEREAFAAALPDPTELMSNQLSPAQARELIDLASAGTTAVVAAASPPSAQPAGAAPPDPQNH